MKTVQLAILALLVAIAIHAGEFAHLGPYEYTYSNVHGTYTRSVESYKKYQKTSYIEYALKQVDAAIECSSTPEEKRKPKNREFLEALYSLRKSCQSMLGVIEMSPHLTKRLELYRSSKQDSDLVNQIRKDLSTPAVQALEGFGAFKAQAEALVASHNGAPDSAQAPTPSLNEAAAQAPTPAASDMADSLKRRLAEYRKKLDKLVEEHKKSQTALGERPESAWKFLANDIENSLSNTTVLGSPSRRTPGHEAYISEARVLLAELKRLEPEVMATNARYNDIQGRLRKVVGAPAERATALSAIRTEVAELPESERRKNLLNGIDADLASAKTAAADVVMDEEARQKRLAEDGATHRQMVEQYSSKVPKVFGVDLKKCLLDPDAYKGTPVRLSLVRIYPITGICRITPLTKDALLEGRYEHPSELSTKLTKAWELQGDFDTVTITLVYDGAKWWVLDVKL